MAQTQFIQLTPEQELVFYKSLESGDRLTFGKINVKSTFLSRKKKAGLTQKSMLPVCAEAWNLLTPTEQEAWKSAGVVCNMKAYNLFVKDKCARIINGISGNATPSDLHQVWVGSLKIEAPATELKITQLHPHDYWVSQKVAGKKGMYAPVRVTEDLSLPLKISCSYKSDLTSTGTGSFARLYARVRSTYQGVDRYTDCPLEFDLSSGWAYLENTISSVIGQVISYALFIHLYNVRGTFLCDNIKAEHSGQNWVRDTYCDDIYQAFTRAFYQIPDHWVPLILPEGSEFGSIYPQD